MPAPEIEWDEAATETLAEAPPEDIEWDNAATESLAPKEKKTSALGAFARQAGQGYLDNWTDEIAAPIASRLDFEGPFSAKDRKGRVQTYNDASEATEFYKDKLRGNLEAGAEEHPIASVLGNVAGAMGRDALLQRAGVPVLSAPFQLVSGALAGAGAADEDTPGGTIGGAGIGLGAAALGHGIGRYAAGPAVGWAAKHGMDALGGIAAPVRDFVQKRIGRAVGDEALEQVAKVEKAANSAQGTYRSAVQAASRDLEVLMREADAMPEGPAKQQIRQFLDSDEAIRLREQVAGNKLETAPERITEMQAKLDNFKALASSKPAAVVEGVEEGLASPVKKHVLPRAATLGHRFIPVGLAGAGALIGGEDGAYVGTALGGVMAVAQGRPGIIIRNLVREPAVRKAFWERAMKLIPSASSEHSAVIPLLERAAAEGEQKFAVASFVLAQQNPAARAMLRAIAEAAKSDENDNEIAAR